jgi:hypothetical protein
VAQDFAYKSFKLKILRVIALSKSLNPLDFKILKKSIGGGGTQVSDTKVLKMETVATENELALDLTSVRVHEMP